MSTAERVALVTGGGRGIGRVVAAGLADAGYRVAIASRSAAQVAAAAAEIGALAIVLDVTDASAVSAAVARATDELGPITLLVNNAGVVGPGGFTWEQPPEAWWEVFEVNVLGTFLCARAALPSMRARGAGRIVNLASGAAFFCLDGEADPRLSSAYMASKAAVVRYTEALAAETRADGIAAFAISPGMVKTDMAAAVFGAEWDEPGLWSAPERTADLIKYLDSGALDALSGRYIHAVDDDWHALADAAAAILADDRHSLRVR